MHFKSEKSEKVYTIPNEMGKFIDTALKAYFQIKYRIILYKSFIMDPCTL